MVGYGESGEPRSPRAAPATHWPALDGVRGVAVVGVMVYHLNRPNLLPGGYLGVDVFFVLSGFLITSLLLREWDSGKNRISFRNFYARRALRLFPALACAIVAAVAFAEINGGLRGRFTLEMLPWVVLYLSNWTRFFHQSGPGSYLVHTWSLAIEEQFYLVWPGIFVLLARGGFRRERVAVSLVGLAGVAMVYRELVIRSSAYGFERVEWGTTDTHVDGLLIGCALAFWLASPAHIRLRPALRNALRAATWACAGVVLALFEIGRFDPHWTQISYPAVSLSAGVVIAGLVTDAPAILDRLLSSAIAVWIGRRSYGLYLYHYIIFMAVPWPAWLHGGINVTEFAITFLVAAVSYRFVELPALRLKRRFRSVRAAPVFA